MKNIEASQAGSRWSPSSPAISREEEGGMNCLGGGPFAATATTPTPPFPCSNPSSVASWCDVEDDDWSAAASSTSGSSPGSCLNDDAENPDETAPRSSTVLGHNRKDGESDSQNSVLSRREQRTVLYFRLLLISAVVMSAAVVGVLTYTYTSRWEVQQFESQYEKDSVKVLQSLGKSLDLTLEGLDALMVSLTRMAKATNQTWPYVTIPAFGVQAEKIRSLDKALYINIYPVVPADERKKWEAYSAVHGPKWVEESLQLQEQDGAWASVFDDLNLTNEDILYWDVIHDYSEWDKEEEEWGSVGLDPDDPGPFLPMWQTSPLIPIDPPYNWDLLSAPMNITVLNPIETHKVTISEAYLIAFPNDTESIEENIDEAAWVSSYLTTDEDPMEPMSDFYVPILAEAADWIRVAQNKEEYGESYDHDHSSRHTTAGILSASLYWRDLLKDILPPGSTGLRIVFDNPCNPTFTYQINNGNTVEFLGAGAQVEEQYEDLSVKSRLLDLNNYFADRRIYSGLPVEDELCQFTVKIYPSTVMQASFTTQNPLIYTAVVVAIFVFVSLVFLCFNSAVERRQKIVMKSVVNTRTLINSVYPSGIRDRLLKEEEEKAKIARSRKRKVKVSAFLSNDSTRTSRSQSVHTSAPIADVFHETTVLFADIVGFSAWASTREPAQVFTLLETLYNSFDKIASRRGVYKVETVGNCYVAVTGLPDPQSDHAVRMVRYAADIREKMNTLTRELELVLGPGTGDLFLKVGVHSGAVVGGVLRGERSRFQLYGDTVNIAATMESSGEANRIQCSQKTADRLAEAGKASWLNKREVMIQGRLNAGMQTYFVEPNKTESSYCESDISSLSSDMDHSGIDENEYMFGRQNHLAPRVERLVRWSVVAFEDALRRLVAYRKAMGREACAQEALHWTKPERMSAREEVVESISLPFSGNKCTMQVEDLQAIQLPQEIPVQLHSFLEAVAGSCQSHDYHNFDHACHVAMYIKQHTQRISSRKETISETDDRLGSLDIVANPLGQAALLFACLIRNYDHPGIPNGDLAKEGAPIALLHKKKSVTEQNALDKAWEMLMDPAYDDLRSYLCSTGEELTSFRQLVVNAVMAMDVSDHELKISREQRWRRAFALCDESSSRGYGDGECEHRRCRASFVFELLAQAADSCHALQDWTIYEKWNRLQSKELCKAFSIGRLDKDPMNGWYEAQIEFFDKHVLPLATRLRDCKIYGTSSDEFLDQARLNRAEWKNKGRRLIEETKWQRDSSSKDTPLRSSSRALARRRKYSKSTMKLPLPSVAEDETDIMPSRHSSNSSFMSSMSSNSALSAGTTTGDSFSAVTSISNDSPPSMPMRRTSNFPSGAPDIEGGEETPASSAPPSMPIRRTSNVPSSAPDAEVTTNLEGALAEALERSGEAASY